MNYELCEKLKGAGFPKDFIVYDGISCNMAGEPHVFDAPTLEELIDACDGRMEELSCMTHKPKDPKWVAHAYSCEECGWDRLNSGYGSTPEEAVANLWLELNKKDKK